jgi:hypothetical protein
VVNVARPLSILAIGGSKDLQWWLVFCHREEDDGRARRRLVTVDI